MLKSQLLAAIQKEIYRHDFSHFEEKGVVVSGCPTCKRRIQSMNDFLDHLARDAMPPLLERLSSEQSGVRVGRLADLHFGSGSLSSALLASAALDQEDGTNQ
jgi:hypothetical protein